MPIENWGGLSFRCKCGARHEINVKEAALTDDACYMINAVGKKMGRRAHVVYDAAIDAETRRKIAQRLDKTFEYTVSEFCPDGPLTRTYCDGVMAESAEEAVVTVCVGGAAVCEYGKYASAVSGRQWIFLCLIPDGDNFACDFARLYDGGVKGLFPGRAPDVLLCDTKLAYPYAAEVFDVGLAVAARNILTVADADFAARIQGGRGCDVINYVLTNCVRQAVPLFKKQAGKSAVRTLFDCLLRISLAKSLCNVKTAYLTGINAFSDMLEFVTGKSEQSLAAASAYTLASVYKAATEDKLPLAAGKDCLAHREAIIRLTGEDCDVSAGFADADAFEKNRERLAFNADIAFRVTKAAAAADRNPPKWDFSAASGCLKTCCDVYSYGGLLSYLGDAGLLD